MVANSVSGTWKYVKWHIVKQKRSCPNLVASCKSFTLFKIKINKIVLLLPWTNNNLGGESKLVPVTRKVTHNSTLCTVSKPGAGVDDD